MTSGGSTKSGPTEWQAHNSTGGGWRRLLRILYYTLPWLDWGFVLVDDFLRLLRRNEAPSQATAILLLLLAMGTPLSWKKTVLSLSNIWLGFQVDPRGPVITMPRKSTMVIRETG